MGMDKMKKSICMFSALILVFVMLFSGCGSSAKSEGDYAGGYAENESGGGMAYDEVTAVPGSADMKANLVSTQKTQERKIIRNASVDIQTDDALGLYKKLFDWAQTNGGYEDSKNQFRSGDANVIEATLKLPPESVTGFLNFAEQSGEVINCNTESQDITDDYYDVQTRLESKRKSLQSYYELLKKASTVEEIGTVQGYINQITEEIESLTGRIKMWDSQVSYASVRVYIREYTDPVKIKKDIDWNTMTFDDMLYMMKSGFLGAVNFIASGVQWILIAVVTISPVWIPLAIILFFILRMNKKKKKKLAQLYEDMQQKKK